MDVLKPLRVFLERGEQGEHFEQCERLMAGSVRLLSFTFVAPHRGRYTVPALCGYGDVALWISNDVQFPGDVSQLWKRIRATELCAVYVLPSEIDVENPSLMLFRNKFCERLTPDFVFNCDRAALAPWVWAGGKKNVGTVEV